MPVPKRKTSKSRRDKRQSCKFIRPAIFAACSNASCAKPLAGHQACPNCGFYKGKKVLLMTKGERAAKRALARAVPAKEEASAPQE